MRTASANKNTHFIAWHDLTYVHAEIVLQVATSVRLGAITPVIVDLTRVWHPSRLRFEEKLLRIFDILHPHSPRKILYNLARELDIEIIKIIKRRSQSKSFFQCISIWSKLPKIARELDRWSEMGRLGPALGSDLVTQVAYDEFASTRRFFLPILRGIRSYYRSYETFLRLLSSSPNSEVVVFNGRLPSHAGILAAAERMGSLIRYYEAGRGPFYYHEEFSPHDRVNTQVIGRTLEEIASTEEIVQAKRSFLEERRYNLQINRFLKLQSPYKNRSPEYSVSSKSTVTIFTSSPEELIGIGPSWDDHAWPSQYDALRAVSTKFLDLGYQVCVRIHPNIATKSWGEYKRAVAAFADLDVQLYLPHDQINTYHLIQNSQKIVVWRSTTGLEAAAVGKATYCLSPTRYDLISDVHSIGSAEELARANLGEVSCDPKKSIPGILWAVYLGRSRRMDMGESWTYHQDIFSDHRKKFRKALRLVHLLDLFLDVFIRPAIIFAILTRLFGAEKMSIYIRCLLLNSKSRKK